MKYVPLLAALFLTGCATHPDNMIPDTVSTVQYKGLSCEELLEDEYTTQSKITQLHAKLSKDANNDKIQAGVGVVLFWPTLFLLEGGDGADAARYKQLKGRHETITRVLEKQCSNLK